MNTPTQQVPKVQLTADHESALLCHEPADSYPKAEHIPLTSDMVLKAVFGSPGSEDVLAALLRVVRRGCGSCSMPHVSSDT